MPAEGVNDCSATNSTQRVDVEWSATTPGGGRPSTERNPCVCVFIVVNVLMCLSDLIDSDA